MSKLEFILYTVLSTWIAGILLSLTITLFNRIEISRAELFERVFSWYVMLPAVLIVLIASAVLNAFYLMVIPILLLTARAYFRPIMEQPNKTAEQPQESQKNSNETITLDDFVGALWTVMKASRNEKNVGLLHLAIFTALIARSSKKTSTSKSDAE